MRIPKLPQSIKNLPFNERQAALQQLVNAELHRQNICPHGQYTAGPTAQRVGVYHRNRGWYVVSNFSNYNRTTGENVPETYLEPIALAAIEKAA